MQHLYTYQISVVAENFDRISAGLWRGMGMPGRAVDQRRATSAGVTVGGVDELREFAFEDERLGGDHASGRDGAGVFVAEDFQGD
jgi:hypothetical protein